MLADEEEDDDEVGEVLTLPLQAHHAMEKMEEFVHKVKCLQKHKHRVGLLHQCRSYLAELPCKTLYFAGT